MLVRDSSNPVLLRRDIPALTPALVDVSSVFNPGCCVWRGREVFLLRVQTRGRETVLVPAERRGDGTFDVYRERVVIEGLEGLGCEIYHVYDPRLTVIEGDLYAVCACDTDDGCRLLTMRSDDLVRWEVVGADREGDRRNGVLFSEKIGGRYARLERPNVSRNDGEPASGDAIRIAYSDDLSTWQDAGEVMRGRPHYWDERIGAGPPPIRTREGWLLIYHGVATHFGSSNIYQAGVCLLALEDPGVLLARSSMNVLEPREMYELVGQLPSVVFPSGAIV
ncbi:MAG: glycoside hydrolase family 130 protein, partial [Planctomycetota bacterium]